MTFFDALLVLLRRWRTVVPVFAIAMVGVFWVLRGVGVEYESFATIVFLPASVQITELNGEEIEETINPYFAAGTTRTLARAVPIAVGSTTTRQQALEAGLSAEYEMVLDDSEPILYVSAKADTPQRSADTLDFVLIAIGDEIERRQDIDPESSAAENEDEQASFDTLSEFRAIADNSASVKVFGTLSVAAVLLAVMAGFAAEGIHQRRDPRYAAVR